MKKGVNAIIVSSLRSAGWFAAVMFAALVLTMTVFGSEHAQAVVTEDTVPNYLTFTAVQAGSTVKLSWHSADWVETSTDGGETWE